MKRIFVFFIINICYLYAAEYPYTKFPENFTFGVATAAHQIEGAWNLSGKTENCWDRLSHSRPELIFDGTNGDVAVDSYNRYAEDVEALKYLGVDFYRFSLSWARILPTGRADFINPEGVQYYNNLINLLLENNIKPLVTLFHWDLPQTLQGLGGWSNPLMIEYFEDYSRICYENFGDRVKSWITFNEPYEICEDGYGDEKKAPALDSHGVGNYLCGDTLLKAHAKSYHLYDQSYRPSQKGTVMISINSIWYIPTDKENQEQVVLAETANQFKFGWFAHPIYSAEGGYPKVMIEQIGNRSKEEGLFRSRLPEMSEEWKNLIRGTADALGINHYTTHMVTPGLDPTAKSPSWLKDIGAVISMEIGEPSASKWLRVVPEGFGDMLRWAQKRYNDPEIIITENGVSDYGTLSDESRIRYFNDYLAELLKAVYDDKVRVTGYTAWTLVDNFEWLAGFSERFGFYSVNITDPSLPRRPKKSADMYKNLLASRELSNEFKISEKQQYCNAEIVKDDQKTQC
ncbi:myrosinase 1-like isoform X1 [Arctopsyche grandis]|uniref:myrosinase 1-like isoform X1 n=1 Tax=Arctopsyche grandis TaxID=121162 RepID=UPI00406D9AD7